MQCIWVLESKLNCTATCVCALKLAQGCVQQQFMVWFVLHAWSSKFQRKHRDEQDGRVHLLLLSTDEPCNFVLYIYLHAREALVASFLAAAHSLAASAS